MKEITHIPLDAPNGKQYLITGRDALIVVLTGRTLPANTEPKRLRLLEMLKQYIRTVSFVLQQTEDGQEALRDIIYTAELPEAMQGHQEEISREINDCLHCYPIQALIHHYITKPQYIVFRSDDAQTSVHQPKTPKQERTFKYSRTLACDIARNTGKDTMQGSLFAVPLNEALAEIDRQRELNPEMERQYWSQKTAMLAQVLLRKYDTAKKDENGEIVIMEPAKLAHEINTNPQHLKKILLYLTQYQYPHGRTKKIENTEVIGIQWVKPFEITLEYAASRKLRLDEIKADRSQTYINLLLNEEPLAITIKPTRQYMEDLKNNNNGSVHITDAFLAFCMELTTLAYKLLHFSITQPPQYAIGEDKLLTGLNLHRQKKSNGMARLRQQILNAGQELLNKGHFLTFNIGDGADSPVYRWEYSSKYIKHKQEYLNGRQQKFVKYDDANTPTKDKRQRMAEYMQQEYKMTPAKAKEYAEKKFPN